MLTNPRDAFKGQSRSTDMVPFDILSMVSYWCSIVILSLKRIVFEILTCNYTVTLKPSLEVTHSRSSEPTRIDPPPMTSY